MKCSGELMEEADVDDWTCPNCGHQSPTRTFNILDQMDEQLIVVLKALKDCHEDMKRLRVSGDAGNYDECKVERQAREILEKFNKIGYNK